MVKRTRFSLILIQHVLTSVPIPITTRCGSLSRIRSHLEIPHAAVSGLIYSRENKATLPNCLPQKPGPGREGHSIRPIATFSEMNETCTSTRVRRLGPESLLEDRLALSRRGLQLEALGAHLSSVQRSHLPRFFHTPSYRAQWVVGRPSHYIRVDFEMNIIYSLGERRGLLHLRNGQFRRYNDLKTRNSESCR